MSRQIRRLKHADSFLVLWFGPAFRAWKGGQCSESQPGNEKALQVWPITTGFSARRKTSEYGFCILILAIVLANFSQANLCARGLRPTRCYALKTATRRLRRGRERGKQFQAHHLGIRAPRQVRYIFVFMARENILIAAA